MSTTLAPDLASADRCYFDLHERMSCWYGIGSALPPVWVTDVPQYGWTTITTPGEAKWPEHAINFTSPIEGDLEGQLTAGSQFVLISYTAGDWTDGPELWDGKRMAIRRQLHSRMTQLEQMARSDYGLSGLDMVASGRAQELVARMTERPELTAVWRETFVSLIFEGELQFEWTGNNGAYVEVEVRKDGSLRVLLRRDGETRTLLFRDVGAVIDLCEAVLD